MEGPSCSRFNYHENCDELRTRLLATTLELEVMKNDKRELLILLKMAYQERDQAREELNKVVNKLTTPTFVEIPSMMIPTPTKANSSITESHSPSHVSSPIDPLLEAISPPELSKVNNVVESNNFGYFNQPLVQNTSVFHNNKAKRDDANEVIESLLKGKTLPQKGKLLKAVKDAGPLLKTLLVAGPLPKWRTPPPVQNINIPSLSVHQDFGSNNVNALLSSLQTPMFASSNSLHPSMLNVDVANNAFQMTSNATCKNLAPSRIPQSHHYLLRN